MDRLVPNDLKEVKSEEKTHDICNMAPLEAHQWILVQHEYLIELKDKYA